MDAPELAELLYDRVICFLGMPKNLVSDRDTLFTSKFWSSLCHYLGAKRRLSTAYHPQTDGQTERQNQIVEHYLRVYTNFQQDDWARWLPLAMFVYNNTVHSSTGMTPMEALTAVRGDLRINVDVDLPAGNAPQAKERAEALKAMREGLKEVLTRATNAQKEQYDKRHKAMSFKIGDMVMIRTKNFRMIRPCRKLDHRQLGSFPIIDAWGKQAYKLRLPPRFRGIHPVFHVSLLELYREREGAPPPPEPILIDGSDEWEIEEILTHRTQRRRVQYLVRWKGYTPADDSWEPEEYLTGAPQMLNAYKQRHGIK